MAVARGLRLVSVHVFTKLVDTSILGSGAGFKITWPDAYSALDGDASILTHLKNLLH